MPPRSQGISTSNLHDGVSLSQEEVGQDQKRSIGGSFEGVEKRKGSSRLSQGALPVHKVTTARSVDVDAPTGDFPPADEVEVGGDGEDPITLENCLPDFHEKDRPETRIGPWLDAVMAQQLVLASQTQHQILRPIPTAPFFQVRSGRLVHVHCFQFEHFTPCPLISEHMHR